MSAICVYCESDDITRNGVLPSGGQRWKCKECSSHFSTGGKRETYSPYFKREVTDYYIHEGFTAQQIVNKYHISTRTLIQRAKKHEQECPFCYDEKIDDD